MSPARTCVLLFATWLVAAFYQGNVDGSEAIAVGPGEHPYLVTVSFPGNVPCAGTILDENWILTSADCVPGMPENKRKKKKKGDKKKKKGGERTKIIVVAGVREIGVSEASEQQREVETVKAHPLYEAWKLDSPALSLLKLKTPLALTPGVAEAVTLNEDQSCPVPSDDSAGGDADTCEVIGWGGESYNQHGTPMKSYLDVLGHSECKKTMREIDEQSSLCYSSHNDATPCNGDFGGPIMCSCGSSSQARSQVAVRIIFGECQYDDWVGAPMVSVRVAPYVDWIRRCMLNQDNCTQP